MAKTQWQKQQQKQKWNKGKPEQNHHHHHPAASAAGNVCIKCSNPLPLWPRVSICDKCGQQN